VRKRTSGIKNEGYFGKKVRLSLAGLAPRGSASGIKAYVTSSNRRGRTQLELRKGVRRESEKRNKKMTELKGEGRFDLIRKMVS